MVCLEMEEQGESMPISKQVNNYQNGSCHQDTLHHRAVKVSYFYIKESL